jgi:hypothetical protein
VLLLQPPLVRLIFDGVVGAVNRDTVSTGVTVAVCTLVALGIVRIVGSWLLESAREDFHDSVRKVVSEEMEKTGKNLAPVWEKMRNDVAAIKKETAVGSGDSMKASQARTELEVGWLMAATRKIAETVGIDLDVPPS